MAHLRGGAAGQGAALGGEGRSLGPAIGAISLGLVGHAAVSDKFGRNARFASLGAGFAAISMGAFGYLVSNRAVFLVTVSLSVFLRCSHLR